jgi:BON domain
MSSLRTRFGRRLPKSIGRLRPKRPLVLRRAPRRRDRVRSTLLAGAPALAAGAALMYFLDRRQGHRRRTHAVQRAAGALRRGARRGKRAARHAASDAAGTLRRAAHPRVMQKPPPDDVTLAHKVETEIFRPAGAPKGTVNVSAVHGIVELRGHVETSKQIRQLERSARRIRGVRDVRNLLHLSGAPAPTDGAGRT